MIQFIDYIRERAQTAKYFLYGTMFAVVIWSLTVDTSHAHIWLEKHIPGFWALFGLVSCIVLIFVARWFAGAGISQEENYYDN